MFIKCFKVNYLTYNLIILLFLFLFVFFLNTPKVLTKMYIIFCIFIISINNLNVTIYLFLMLTQQAWD